MCEHCKKPLKAQRSSRRYHEACRQRAARERRGRRATAATPQPAAASAVEPEHPLAADAERISAAFGELLGRGDLEVCRKLLLALEDQHREAVRRRWEL